MSEHQTPESSDISALGDHFIIESHVLATRSADAYKAVDKGRGAGICLWMLRHPLAPNSDARRRFVTRLQRIREVSPPVSDLIAFGVDASGMAFAELPALDGHPVVAGNVEVSEAERRFMSCVRLVEQLHTAGIVCGDLCGASFWVGRGGEVRFIGVMGSFDTEAAATAMLPPVEALHFVAPEQRSGGGIEPASDVFALGVLGYFLLTGGFPYGAANQPFVGEFDLDKVRPISDSLNVPPAWAEEVLRNCLHPSPERRYRSAGEVHRAIVDSRHRAQAGESAPVTASRQAVPLRRQSGKTAVQEFRVKPPEAKNPGPPRNVARERVRLGILAAAALGGGFLVYQVATGGRASDAARPSGGLDPYRSAAGTQLREAMDVLGESKANITELQAQLDKLANSDDPLAHDTLVRSARDAATEEVRLMSEKAILDRARRLGLMRASEQVRQWLRTLKSGELPSSYEAVLKALDTTLPGDARDGLLRQAYASNPRMAMKLATALALDTNKLDEYQQVVSQMIADYLQIEEASDHSLLALILSHQELALLFGDDVVQRRDQIPDKDVVWLLRVLADRSDVNIRALANVALERNLLPPLRASFLTLIRNRNDLSSDVTTALIRSATGSLPLEQVATFGRWYDTDAERVLLAVLADNTDPAMLQEAFDILAGKSLTVDPSAQLVGWVRRNYWEQRAGFARAIGILGSLQYVSEDQVVEALTSLDQFAKDRSLVELLVDSENPLVTRVVVERHAELLGTTGLLKLLESKDAAVRISAIEKLKNYNEVGALKFIIDHYQREKDPAVREAYRESFWVIRQREGIQ